MKSYSLAALAPLATPHRFSPPGETGDPGAPGGGTEAITTGNIQIELPEFDPKYLPGGPEEDCIF